MLGTAAAVVDRAATLAAGSARRRKPSRSERLGHGQRLEALSQIADLYRDAADFYRAPRVIEPVERLHEWSAGGRRVVDVAWPSEEPTYLPELSDRYAGFRENRVAAALLFLAPEPRPLCILIHGYLGGAYAFEQRVWPIDWLSRIGLDVALFVLPFHGVRADPSRSGVPPFPSSDPRFTNEGFRQAMHDLGDLSHWLRRRGHPAVGVMGMSLGGYSTALSATLDSELAFAVPIIPLASLADFARDQGRLGRSARETDAQHRALSAAHRVVSPLARAPVLPPERVLVIGARADRITPVEHARRLAHHFNAPIEAWHGGHLLQLGRADKFRRIGRLLDELGLTRR